MAMFMVCVALMIAAALAFVLVPLLRHRAGAADSSARRLRALDQALAAGVIDADEHARKRQALTTSSSDAKSAQPSRAAFAALLLVALLLPASALLLYRLVGAPQALDPANVAAAPDEQGPDMQKAIAALAARLAQQPGDAEGWALLARAYQATGRNQESLDAYRHAHELAKDNPAVTVEYAQALAVVAPDHRIQGESRELLEGVVKADPSNQRALWLLGISDYQANRYDSAIARWNTLLPLLEANSDVAASVKQQIAEAEAKRDGKEPPAAAASENDGSIAASAAPTKSNAPGGTATVAPRLTVQVSLDPELAGKLDADATLFVFARAASGPPMPLAIQRLKASQLPLTVTLDESMGMLPNMKLSMFPQVVIGARISKSGNALPQSGDLQVLSAPLDMHRSEPIALVIDQVVP